MGSNPSLSAILFSSLWFSSIGFCCIRQVECVTVWRRSVSVGGMRTVWEAGGVSAAPHTPCVRHGAGARLGRRLGRTRRQARAGGNRAAEIRGLFPLFCGKSPSHFRSPSPVPSQYEFAWACLTAAVFHGSAVRGETRHPVPLSLPRTPLFPDRSAELASGISTAPRPSHGNKRSLHFRSNPAFSRAQARLAFPLQPSLLTGTSTVGISPATRLSRGHKRCLYFHCPPAFSRAQAR